MFLQGRKMTRLNNAAGSDDANSQFLIISLHDVSD
jgi:hypothetical protein